MIGNLYCNEPVPIGEVACIVPQIKGGELLMVTFTGINHKLCTNTICFKDWKDLSAEDKEKFGKCTAVICTYKELTECFDKDNIYVQTVERIVRGYENAQEWWYLKLSIRGGVHLTGSL